MQLKRINNIQKDIFFTSFKTTGPTILDKASFIAYDPPKTILWAVHNIFELIAFASSYEIGAKCIRLCVQ